MGKTFAAVSPGGTAAKQASIVDYLEELDKNGMSAVCVGDGVAPDLRYGRLGGIAVSADHAPLVSEPTPRAR